jgi:thiol:disulfide interchange protein DsbD
VPRLFFAIGSFCFALYMVPGLWGAPLKLLSGFIPPANTQEFNLEDLEFKLDNAYLISGGSSANSGSTNSSSAQAPKKYTTILEVPYGLTAYFDLEEGMAAAKALNKPVMLDFTGHSCANCRKMEQEVWKNPAVLKLIREEFVLVSLYVDESQELPLDEQYNTASGDRIETVGNKNLDYEVTKFGFNAQPLYKFLDLKGNPLNAVNYGYDPDVDKFITHLKGVVQKFKNQK